MKKVLYLLTVTAFVLVICCGADAAMTIKLATIGPESGTTQATAEAAMMEYIEKASNGDIQVEYYPNAVLGGDLALAEALSNGIIEMANLSPSVLTAYAPLIGILDMPFLFSSADSALKAMNEGKLGAILSDAMAGTGIRFAETWGFGNYRGLSNSARPVEKPTDMQGMKVRVMESPVYIDSFTLLGANPTPLSFAELFSALQNKTVEGQDNDPSLTYTSKFYEVQTYYTDLAHITSCTAMSMSADWYNGLSDENKTIIDEACRIYAESCTTNGMKVYEDSLKLLADSGMTVTRLTPEQRKVFQDAVSSMYGKYIAEWGQEIFDAAQAYN
jgi:tripartite ATP-independent transporter DctP family solute receptor